MNVPASPSQRRGRLQLLLLASVFILPILLAWLLNSAGLVPAPDRQHGELLQPPIDLRGESLALADGGTYAWNPEARLWRVVALPPAACGADCVRVAGDLDKVWRLLGHNADRLDVLWAGAWPDGVQAPDTLRLLQPDPGLRARLGPSGGAGTSVHVVDPNGFVVLRYPAGFDAAGLHADLKRLVKLK
jgi:hypothetical protein